MADSTSKPVFLYDAALSSYAQKIRIALREKGIPFTVHPPPGMGNGKLEGPLFEVNARMQIPTLIDGDTAIYDSTIIMEYLDEKWPEPAFLPPRSDPAARAYARMTEEICDTTYEAVNWGVGEIQWFDRAEGDLKDHLLKQAAAQTKVLQSWLTERLGSKDFFNGDTFGWADICVAPIVNRSVFWKMGPEEGSPLANWLTRIKERESIKATFAEFDAAADKMGGLKPLFISGQRKREYRDFRLEWLIKSGGIDVVTEGVKNNNIRFSWPEPL